MSMLRSIRPLLAAAALVLFSVGAHSQPAGLPPIVRPLPPPSITPAPSATVTLPSDARLRQKLEAAHDYVKAQDWGEAVRVLQILLDVKDDEFLPTKAVPAPNKSASYSDSIRGETLHLLADLPPKGRAAYEQVHGAQARALLKQAIERDDRQLLAQLAYQYLYTAAGAEAAERLGTHHLDRGNADFAARCFAHLLSRPDAERLAPLTLYKAALACRLAHDSAHEEQAWKLLANQAPDGLTIGGQLRDLDQMRVAAARLSAEPVARRDWPMFRGDVGRSSRGDGDLPLLEPLWTRSTVSSKGRGWIDDGLRAQARTNRLSLPGFYPIALPGRVVYRSHTGIHAVDPTNGRDLWEKPALSPLGLDSIVSDSGKVVVVRNWLQGNFGDAYHFPIEGSALGCLSSDGERVYAVEDLAIPPPAEVTLQMLSGVPRPAGPLSDALVSNRLRAIHLDTGAVLWEKDGRAPGDLHNCCFLGSPLPVAGQLYALADQEGEVRLLCLDPASGAVIWSQRLGTTPIRMALDPGRRLRGVQMTCAGGLLLCPTDAGALFAFDLFSRRLAWAYVYPSKKQLPTEGTLSGDLAGFNAAWRESAPVVADGKVVLAPNDSDRVHCVSLPDGKPLWQQGQGQSAYFAGLFHDKVLLVGAAGIGTRALLLKDGRQMWVRNLGVPSGQGAARGDVYYLPLKRSTESGGPGVVAFDADIGKVLAFAPARDGEVPGNLTFFGGLVISQTATSLTAYPQLKTRLKRIEELLAANPRNPRGLMERGTLRLYQGDVPGALADLRAAVEGSATGAPKEEAQARLHEGLRQVLQRDFAAGEKYLAEFERSCRVPLESERGRREANYLLILARGREGQGRIAEALAAYARLYGRADQIGGVWKGPEIGWMLGGKQDFIEVEDRAPPGGTDEKPIAGSGPILKRYPVPSNRAEEVAEVLKVMYKDAPSVRITAVGNNEIMVFAPLDVQIFIAEQFARLRGVAVPLKPQTVTACSTATGWIHGRITTLLMSARSDQQADIKKEVARQWKAIPVGADVEELGRFVALFGTVGPVGCQARLTYAEQLAALPDRSRFLEAELHLLALQRQREEPQLAARALELLARSLTEKGHPDEALYYYRQLAEDFKTTPVRDGKTGADFLKELARDRRFLPLLDDLWAGRKYKTAEVRGVFPPPGSLMGMEPEGEAPPCLRRQRLVFDTAGGKLKLIDRNTGAELWSQAIFIGNLRSALKVVAPQTAIPYRVEGHLAVVSLGHMVYGIDLLDRRLLWTKDLLDKTNPIVQEVGFDGPDRPKIIYGDGTVQPLGRISPIRPAGVCFLVPDRWKVMGSVVGGGRDQWVALDPLHGDTLWTKPATDQAAEIFTDDSYVYLTEGVLDGNPMKWQAVSWRGGVGRSLGVLPVQPRNTQIVGRNLLLLPGTPPNKLSHLALYDPLTGKEVWSLRLALEAWFARSDVPHLTATIGLDGKVRVWDLRRREELFQSEVDPKHLRDVQEVRLFRDDTHYYLLLNQKLRPADNVAGPAAPNAIGGLRGLPVHGFLYAFHRDDGKRHWWNEVRSQSLILEQFEQSPLLLFSAVVQRTNLRSPVLTFTSIDKHTGKTLLLPTDYALSASPVNRVEIDPAMGMIDLVTLRWKIRHTIAE